MLKTTSNFKLVRLILGYLSILAVLLGNGWFLYNNFNKMSEQEAWVSHTRTVISSIELALAGVIDIQSGVRGYLLSNDETYLEGSMRGEQDARAMAMHLLELTQDNPVQQSNAKQLKELIERRVQISEEMVDKRRQRQVKQAEINAFMNEGRILMSLMRSHVSHMIATEENLLRDRKIEADNSRQFFMYSLFGSTVLAILILSAAYVQFRRSDLRNEEELAESQHLAEIRENMAEVAKITGGEVSLEEIGSQVLVFLGKRLDVLAGKLYIMEKGVLEVVATFGVSEEGHLEKKISDASLLSEAMKKEEVWEVKEIPSNFWKLRSGLGESRPKNIIFLPIRFQNRAFALFELGAFQSLKESDKELLSKITEILAVNLSSAQSREHLHVLLEETQTQAEELQSQQEELRTTNEELEQQARALESQQEAMAAKNHELETTQRDLQFKAKELELASQYKSEFLAKMSHELRTPLNGLLILSSLLFENKENNLTDQQKQFAKSIYNAGNDLLSLINDILDLSKIEARKLRLTPESVSVAETLEQMRLVFEPQAKAKSINLNVVVSSELRGKTLSTDRQRLEQVLRNFLSNAIKFTEKGSIFLEAQPVKGDKNLIDIIVKDTGLGIPAEKQSLVFEAFEQADGSVSRRFGGTGLGLTISRELAALLGGEILLQSTEGKGSTFTLRIPVVLPEQAAGDVKTASTVAHFTTTYQPPLSMSASSPKAIPIAAQTVNLEAQNRINKLNRDEKTILIVEDDDKFRSSIVEVTQSYGYQAIEAEDGELAVAILQKMTPKAILLDIKLPGISGMGILEMIKQMPHLRHVPVHMISALDYQLNALRMGALGYLTKPVTMEKVKSALDRIEHMLTDKVRRVLLIEDDERQSEAVSNLIAGSDVQVVTAHNGQKAIELLKKGNIDCIILDLSLPDLSGFDLLEKLNSLHISLPPVVIYTGKDLSSEEEEKLRKYSQSIIIKGARSPERLLDEVNLFLHRVESMLPLEKREMLNTLRSQDRTFEGKNILLVDDDLRNLFALTSALEGRGCNVKTAKNGTEAIEALEKDSNMDIVLMDIMMPKMDGYEAMRRIRRHDDIRLRKIPIIALTAKAMKEDHEKCIEAGASDYLPKPVNLENLYTAMKVWLSPKGIFA